MLTVHADGRRFVGTLPDLRARLSGRAWHRLVCKLESGFTYRPYERMVV